MAGINIARLEVSLDLMSAAFHRNLRRAANDADRRNHQIAKTFLKSKTAVAAMSAAVVGFAATISAATATLSANARELERNAYAAGMSTSQFNEMSLAVASVGITTEQFGSIMADTQEKVGEFITAGTGGFNDFIEVMGMSEEQGAKVAEQFATMSGDQVLGEMVKQMEAAGASGQQLNFALESMAGDARYLIPLLSDGGTEMARLQGKAEALATTMSKDVISSLNSMNAAQSTLANNMRNLLGQSLASIDWLFIKASDAASIFFRTLTHGTMEHMQRELDGVNEEIAELESGLGDLESRSQFSVGGVANLKGTVEQTQKMNDLLDKRFVLEKNIAETKKQAVQVELPQLQQAQAVIAIENEILETKISNEEKWQDFVRNNSAEGGVDIPGSSAWIEHQRELSFELFNLKQEQNEKLLDADHQFATNSANLWEEFTGKRIAADQKMGLALVQNGIKFGGMLFDANKREALKTAAIDGYAAIQKAWAIAPFPLNLPSIAAATAGTAANLGAIQGIAHNGLSRVPNEGTYLLDKDEAVLKKQDADKYRNGEMGGPTNVSINVNALDSAGVEDVLVRNRDAIARAVSQSNSENWGMA